MSKEAPLKNARLIPRDQIRPNPKNARKRFDPDALRETADTIREYGILQPLLVRYEPSRYDATPYIILAGERRWRASEGILDALPCVVSEVEKGREDELSLIENLQRVDLTPLEEANGLRNLMEARNIKAEAAAKLLGKTAGWANNRTALLKTKPDVLEVAARTRGTMSSLLLVDKVADNETRAELLEAVENETPHELIKARVQAHFSDEKWKRDSQTPDRETSARIATVAQNNGISTSRGKPATGNTSREAYETIQDALTQIGWKTNTIEHWYDKLTDAQKANLAPGFKRLAETFKRFSES